MPIDMNDSGTKAQYELNPIEVARNGRFSSTNLGRMALGGVRKDDEAVDQLVSEPYPIVPNYGQRSASLPRQSRASDMMDDFRDWMGDTLCGCCASLPSFLLIVILLLFIGVVISVAVLIFMFSTSGSALPLTMQGQGMKMVRPPIDAWPLRTDDDNDVNDPIDASKMFPANVSTCGGFGFACTADPNMVVSTTVRCDGKPDCRDSSDEVGCRACQTPFSCKANPSDPLSKALLCLTSQHICDGVAHCPDSSDEKDCGRQCEESEFECGGNVTRCLPGGAVCDGIKDCPNGDDERECARCTRGAKLCASTEMCIPPEMVCNGAKDCDDGSDEQDCTCRACSGSGRALCGDGSCVRLDQICDGVSDCTDGMDEQSCPGTCPNDDSDEEPKVKDVIKCSDGLNYIREEACSGRLSQCAKDCKECDNKQAFTCKDGMCIHQSQVCNGKTDCSDGSDEKDCNKCPVVLGHFKCFNSTKCISEKKRCDGVWDCADGSDERECDECPPSTFRCPADRMCIPMMARCDGRYDCRDRADEKNCACNECTAHLSATYMCEGSGRCMARSEVCSPYTTCQSPTKADVFFCAQRAQDVSRRHLLF